VSAEEVNTGRSETVTIEGGVGLSAEEIAEMREEARANEAADRRRRRRIEARNRLRDSVSRAQRLLSEPEGLDSQVVTGLERVLDEAERVLNNDDAPVEELNRAHDRFEEILSELDVPAGASERLSG
jgi:molecular chaperone DnaK